MEILEKREPEDSSVYFLALRKHKYIIVWIVKVD